MAPRRRQTRKVVGNTRMDAALDAMTQLGFEKKLIRKTAEELLDVYEGNQGWPFIEESSYKLLIETLLCKDQTCDEDKDDARRDDVGETSSAATPATGITEVGSSYLMAQDNVSRGNDDLDSASQTNDHDHDSAPIGNVEVEVGVKDTTVPTKRGRDRQGISVKSKKGEKPMDNVKESNHETFVSNVETTTVKNSMIESSKTSAKLPQSRYRPCNGWISSDDNNVDIVYLPLPKRVEKLIGKSVAPERRKSRWDEKPDDM